MNKEEQTRIEELEFEVSKLLFRLEDLEQKQRDTEKKLVVPWAKNKIKDILIGIRRTLIPHSIRKNIRENLLRQGIYSTMDTKNLSEDAEIDKVSIQPYEKNLPLVSIIITNFNYGSFLGEAITSIRNQTFQDFEVIIVDDKSTDEQSLAVLKDFSKEYKVIFNEKNVGPGASRNIGVKSSKGKYITFLDADDTYEPTYLEKCVTLLESYPSIDITHTHVNTFGAEERKWALPDFDIEHLYWNNIITNNALHRREVWEKTGGYSETREMKYEDWDYWMRAAEKRLSDEINPRILV